MSKYVYLFGSRYTEGDASMKNLLGGKGANLAEMCNLGIPVPAGFTITTEVCIAYYDNKKQYPAGLQEMVKQAMGKTEEQMGMTFLVILPIRCWCLSVPAPVLPCPG